MLNKIKVSAVSYTNSIPFVYGLMHSGILEKIDLSLDIPSDCANKLIENKTDIGLVPVAALLDIPGYQIVSQYCIGATGIVDSVFIFSDKAIQEVKSVCLDPQSRTSNNLARVLMKNYWNLKPEFVQDGTADAFVQIGDRTFGKQKQYSYSYDLAEEWQKFMGLPFVFAVWASNKPIADDFVKDFNEALKFGLENREVVIDSIPAVENFDIGDYLMNKIDYDLNEQKLLALRKFHEFIKAL